jgi:linoleoyl-CoA desaturase
MGIFLVLIYLNLIHEAAHNNIYKSKRLNRMVLHIFDFIGANSYIWKKRHIASHHAYPNVDGWDTDIEQSGFFNSAMDQSKRSSEVSA